MNNKGFTLMELMIALAIIGIIASIAYPSYQNSVAKTKRNLATGCLAELAQGMERYYTTKMTYVDATLPANQCQSDLGDHYTFALAGTPTSKTYTISAKAKGSQASGDSSCSTLTLNQNAIKTPADCWQ